MAALKTSGRSVVIVTELAAVTILSLGLAITIHFTTSNTLAPSTGLETLPRVQSTPVVSVTVPVQLPQEESREDRLNSAIGALSSRDAGLYRTIFESQKSGDIFTADTAIAELEDTRLLGHVLADRYVRSAASAEELGAWLERYADYPEASAIYNLAKSQKGVDINRLVKPTAAELWSAGHESDSIVNFSSKNRTASSLRGENDKRLVRAVNGASMGKNPSKALKLLIAAQTKHPLSKEDLAEDRANIAAGFFYNGEREKARLLAKQAAEADHPLGLWICGLIAWEDNNLALAQTNFVQLANHPDLDASSRAAAHFWIYRVLNKLGNDNEARDELEQTAQQPNSFYGMLAAQTLDQMPVAAGDQNYLPAWTPEYKAVLASYEAGWRALALVQIGQDSLAEMELRRLNPQGQSKLQRAMLALANFVPMPALAVHLASLSGSQNIARRTALLYPMLPWKPQNGFKIDRALIYALARRESRFDPTAVSSRGAKGLMQIMPKTANGMTKDELDESRLFDPSYNLALGQKYVRHLARQPKIGDSLLLLLAAYNRGPGKVLRWVDTERMRTKWADDPLLFIESIPVRETRNYVMSVLAHYWVYQTRLNEPLITLKQLAEDKWPRISLDEPAAILKVASN